MNEQTLKDHLTHIRETDFQLSQDVSLDDLTAAMVAHIGSVDGHLRDQLIYNTFFSWLETKPVYTTDQLRHLLTTLLDDQHLGYKLGEQGDDSVFTRSFSMLVVPLLLIRHRAEPFLSADEVRMIHRKVIDTSAAERDLRGYVPGKGWAHAPAHTADALNELSLCAELGHDDLIAILEAVRAKIAYRESTYGHGEEERFGEVIDSIISRGLVTDAEWNDWFAGFVPLTAAQIAVDYAYINIKNFLHSLYYRAHHSKWSPGIQAALENVLATLWSDE